MRRRLLEYVVCPECRADLQCTADDENAAEILTGRLRCGNCGRVYPIVRGIPRLLRDATPDVEQRTAANFGWQWRQFKALAQDHATTRSQFLDWVVPLDPTSFRGKVVADAGCGMGRWPMVASELGARDVLAFDMSDAVEAARENLAGYPNVHVLQADIYHLPFRCGAAAQVDCVYSIGVLHHLPDPRAGFLSLVRIVRAGGVIHSWVYGRENNEWIVRYVNPIRRHFTSHLPSAVLYGLAFAITCVLQPVLKMAYRPAPAGSPPPRGRPYYAYLSWLGRFGFRHTHHVVHDHLTAPIAEYIRRDEFAGWFADAGLSEVQLLPRNANSWRGFGVKPPTPGAAVPGPQTSR